MPVFIDDFDYRRTINLLYIANCTERFDMYNLRAKDIYEMQRSETLVEIVAYCLMPNHFHIAVKSKTNLESDPGISKFIQKFCTGYTMYFNKKYDHSGTIWEGSYHDKFSDQETIYMQTLIDYIHLNPYAIITPNLTKDERRLHRKEAIEYSKKYEYSSFKDYLCEVKPHKSRKQKAIISETEFEKWKNCLLC